MVGTGTNETSPEDERGNHRDPQLAPSTPGETASAGEVSAGVNEGDERYSGVTPTLPSKQSLVSREEGQVTERAILRNGEVWTEVSIKLARPDWNADYMDKKDPQAQRIRVQDQRREILETVELLKMDRFKPGPDEEVKNTGGAEFEVRFVSTNPEHKGAPAFIGDQYIPWACDIFNPTREQEADETADAASQSSPSDPAPHSDPGATVQAEVAAEVCGGKEKKQVPNDGGGEKLIPVLIQALKVGREGAVRHVCSALVEAQPTGPVLHSSLQERADQLVQLLVEGMDNPQQELEALTQLNSLLGAEAKKNLSLHIVPELGREQFEINATMLPEINGEHFEGLVKELRLHMSLAAVFSAEHDAMPFLTGALPTKLASHFTEDHMYPKARYELLYAGVEEMHKDGEDAHFPETYRLQRELAYFAPDKPWTDESQVGAVKVDPKTKMVTLEDFQARTIYRIENTGIHLESHNTANQTHDQPVNQMEYRAAHHQTDLRQMIMSALSGCASGFCEYDTGFNDNRTPIGWFGGIHPLHNDLPLPDERDGEPEGWLREDDDQLCQAARRGQILPFGVVGSDKNLVDYIDPTHAKMATGMEAIKGYHPPTRTTFHFDEKSKTVLRRPESRAASAGPTIEDMTANIAFEWGLSEMLAEHAREHHGLDLNADHVTLEKQWPYGDIRQNRRQVERFGLHTHISWFPSSENGGFVSMHDILVNELVPLAREGLRRRNFSEEQIARYIGTEEQPGVIMRRLGFTVPEQIDGVSVRDVLAKRVNEVRAACEGAQEHLRAEYEKARAMGELSIHDEQPHLERLRAVGEQLTSLNRLATYFGVDGQQPRAGVSPSDAFRLVRDVERLIRDEHGASELTARQMAEEISVRQADMQHGTPSKVASPSQPGVDVASWLKTYLKGAAERISQRSEVTAV